MTEKMTGKPYETGDLSIELDKRVKSKVAEFCGNEEYAFGDLTKEIDARVQVRVAEYTGKDNYEFGDISKQVEKNRKQWVQSFLGDEAAAQYQFGDITTQAMKNFTGNDEYQVRKDTANGTEMHRIELNRTESNRILSVILLKWTHRYHTVYIFLFPSSIPLSPRLLPPRRTIIKFGDVTKKLMGNIFGGKRK